ncbi:MAG TPA: hypothetical protein VFJ97_13795 [Dermatophilaceae bacterium]|nr:hypothetical protein [Dermatophilaceae bacterium]
MALALSLGPVAGCTTDADPEVRKTSPTTTPTASTSASTTTPPPSQAQLDLQSAEKGISNFWTVLDRLAADPRAKLDALATVSRSPSLGVWQQQLTKQRIDGRVQVGSSQVVQASATRKSAEEFAVVACIDVSKVNVVDKAGKSVVSANRLPRVKYEYVVTEGRGADAGFYVTQDRATAAC